MIKWKTHRPSLLLLGSYIFLLLFFFFFTFFNYANDKPRGIHQWAQADRLSIAERYIEGRGLNDPATLSMKTEDGKVGVEFSGYQYVLAQVVRAGFNKAYLPLLYRLLTFVIFFTAFFFFVFKSLKEENLLYRMALFVGLMSSPILLYYSYNFLPDILALSILLVCFYLVNKDLRSNYIWVVLLSGLALLIKTSSGIYFISFYAIYFLASFKKWDKLFLINTLLFFAIAGGVAYYDYVLVNLRNQALNSYVFLSGTRPAQSMQEFWNVFDTASRFLKEYFNAAQWTVFWLAVGFYLFRIKKIKLKDYRFQLVILLTLGLLSIIALFGVQYKDHDYYVLGTFMPIVLYLIVMALKGMSEYVHPRASLVLALIFAVTSFTLGSNRHFNRMSETVVIDGWPEKYERNWLVDADKKIAPFVKKDELVVAVYVPEPNFALIYVDRKGATFNTEEMGRDQSPFPWFLRFLKANFVVCKTSNVEQFKLDEAEFFIDAKVLYQDDDLTLFYGHGY